MVHPVEFFGCKLQSDASISAPSLSEMLEFFDLLKPKASSFPLIRIGGNYDGSYLIPDDLSGIKACFSPGMNNFKHFEDTLVETYGIDCHMCDYSSDVERFKTPLIAGRQTFQKKWLDVDGSSESISLDQWVQGSEPSGDLLLQMDIEGAEYRNLIASSDEVLSRFRIIVMEVHGLTQIGDPAILRGVLAPFFRRMSKWFDLIHVHPNNYGHEYQISGTSINIPDLLELTYLRKDRNLSPSYTPLIPHPLDVGQNVIDKPPLFLGEEWLEGGRPIESRIKMLEDRLDAQTRLVTARPSAPSKNELSMVARSLATLTRQMGELAHALRPSEAKLTEVAAGCPYVLSSSYDDGVMDGNVQNAGSYFFHTKIGIDQFIRIDLGKLCNIQKVIIKNRSDECFDRARELFLVLDGVTGRESVYYFDTPAAFLDGRAAEAGIEIPISLARFVTVTSPAETALHFSEIRIYSAG